MRASRAVSGLLFAAAVCLVFCDCASTTRKRIEKKHKELSTELCDVASDFTRRIVWKDFDGAGLLIVPEKRVSFFENAGKVAARVSIENFKVALCQVAATPFAREDEDVSLTAEKTPAMPEETLSTPKESVEGAEPAEPVEPAIDPEAKPEKKEKLKMPKVFYGVALVRLINVSVVPSNKVQNRLMKQYWVWTDDVWMCDMDVEELLE